MDHFHSVYRHSTTVATVFLSIYVQISDEMGCGKTTTAITVAAHYRYSWPLLVICPSALRLNWRDELLMRLGPDGLGKEHITIVGSGKDVIPQPQRYGPPSGIGESRAREWGYAPPLSGGIGPASAALAGLPPHPGLGAGVVIISYDLASTFAEKGMLRPGSFRFAIADESHALKSMDAKRTRICLPLLQRATYTLLMSGTPALNRPKELYTQIW